MDAAEKQRDEAVARAAQLEGKLSAALAHVRRARRPPLLSSAPHAASCALPGSQIAQLEEQLRQRAAAVAALQQEVEGLKALPASKAVETAVEAKKKAETEAVNRRKLVSRLPPACRTTTASLAAKRTICDATRAAERGLRARAAADAEGTR